jgi:hypothetical protein
MALTYLLVQYAEADHGAHLRQFFGDLDEVQAFLTLPENAWQKWEILKIEKQIKYSNKVVVNIWPDESTTPPKEAFL